MLVRNPYFGSGKPWSGTAQFIAPEELTRLASIEASTFNGEGAGPDYAAGAAQDRQAAVAEQAIFDQLSKLQVQLTVPSTTRTPASSVVSGSGRAMLMIPIKFAAPIANSTASAASVSAQLNLVLAQLRLSGILPP